MPRNPGVITAQARKQLRHADFNARTDMPTAVSGALITTDAATKVYILSLETATQFLIEDLDETHLLVDPAFVDLIYEEIEKRAIENTVTDD